MYKNLNWWNFEIETRSFKSKTTKSANFLAEMIIIYDAETQVIYWYFFKIKDVFIDCLTTKSWFLNDNTNFRRRNSLFNLLNIKQKPRNRVQDHFLIHYNQKQNPDKLNIINKFINENINNITIKNLVSLFSGNNPTGELSNYRAAPIILSKNQKLFGTNFAIFFENYSLKNTISKNEEIFLHSLINDEKFKNDYFESILENKNLKEIHKCIEDLAKDKTKIAGQILVQTIKKFVDVEKINKLVNIERTNYKKNTENLSIFSVFKNSFAEEKCHILPVFVIKSKMIKKSLENRFKSEDIRLKEIQKIAKNISDKNNYLNFDATWHAMFDKQLFSYNHKNGQIIWLKEPEMQNEIVKYTDIYQHIKQIPKKYLNNERKKYIRERNNYFRIVNK